MPKSRPYHSRDASRLELFSERNLPLFVAELLAYPVPCIMGLYVMTAFFGSDGVTRRA